MLIKQTAQQILQKLYFYGHAEVDMGTIENIAIKLFDNRSQISFLTSVYVGQEFIPFSVRNCLTKTPPFNQHGVPCYLTMDEANYQLFLNYKGDIDELNGETLSQLLDEFQGQAEEWRLFLDENDKNDLIHVRQSR